MNILGQQIGEIKIYEKAKYLLGAGAAVIVFRKKNNEIRTMLCTRNIVCASLAGFDTHLNTKDTLKTEQAGNLIVTDLVIGETRQININRVLYSLWFTQPTNQLELDELILAFEYVKKQWADFDNLDPIYQSVFCRSFNFTKPE